MAVSDSVGQLSIVHAVCNSALWRNGCTGWLAQNFGEHSLGRDLNQPNIVKRQPHVTTILGKVTAEREWLSMHDIQFSLQSLSINISVFT